MIKSPEWRSERTVALFLLGAIATSPPFLAIFALDRSVFGIPLLYAYLFAVWAALIALLAVLSGTGKDDGAAADAAETPGAQAPFAPGLLVPPVGGPMKESPASPAGRPAPPAREG
jgi:hypothetical protein